MMARVYVTTLCGSSCGSTNGTGTGAISLGDYILGNSQAWGDALAKGPGSHL